MDYKKFLNRVAIAFIVLLIFLTFFSRTLLDLSVPRVSVAFIARDIIHPEAISTGIVTPLDTERVFAPVSGRITQILAVGEETSSATVLFAISSDYTTLRSSLEQEEHNLRVNTLAIEQTISNRDEAQRRLRQLQQQPAEIPNEPVLNLWEFDLQLDANTASMEALESDIATLEILYEQGVVPRQDIISREVEMERLLQAREEIYTRRKLAEANYENALLIHAESVNATERTRNEQIQAQQNIITGFNFTLTGHQIERERIEARIESLQEQIKDGGVVYVQMEGPRRLVTEVYLDIGSMVMEGMPVMTTSISNNQFLIQASFPQSQDFIRVGQSVDVFVGTNEFSGTTTRIIPDGANNLVNIHVTGSQLASGQLARVTVSGGSSNHAQVIPISALRENQQGYFIMFVTPYERRLGSDYIVYQLQVDLVRRDARNAAITGRFGSELPTGPIIVNSDMPIGVNQRVRLVGSNDFEPTR